MSVVVVLPYPPSANRYVRHTANGSYRTSEANRYRKQAQIIALAAGMNGMNARHFGPVAIHATLHPRLTKAGKASGTRIDLDNCLKVALDALQGVAFENDKQVRRISLEVGPPIDGGGLTLRLNHGKADAETGEIRRGVPDRLEWGSRCPACRIQAKKRRCDGL